MLDIVIDTREQTPWSFDPGQARTFVNTLKTGDYALVGDGDFAIERKSLDDFLGTVSSGWERFLREIGRMDSFVAKVIIVEGDYESVCFVEDGENKVHPPEHNHPRLFPAFVNKRIAQLTMMGVSVIFAGNAGYASALALGIFKERAIQINE